MLNDDPHPAHSMEFFSTSVMISLTWEAVIALLWIMTVDRRAGWPLVARSVCLESISRKVAGVM